MADSKEKIRVYKLIEASKLKANEPLIRNAFFQALGMRFNQQEHLFEINEISGWICYQSKTQLFSDISNGPLLSGEKELRVKIADFISKLDVAIKDDKQLQERGIVSIIPPSIKFAAAYQVKNGKHGKADHWLVRTQVGLRVDNRVSSGVRFVLGAGIDFRLGKNGAIIALSIRWRAPESVSAVRQLQPKFSHHAHGHGTEQEHHNEEHHEEAHHEEAHVDHEDRPEVVYRIAGQNTAQVFLAPYYMRVSGHHNQFAPASKYSLLPRIIENHFADSALLTATVEGGSGDYDFEWGYWQPHNRKAGFTLEPGARQIELPLGVYTVGLFVRDKRTGAVAQAQSSVYATGVKTGDQAVIV